DRHGRPSQGGPAVHAGAAPVLAPAPLGPPGGAALPGDRPATGGCADEPVHVPEPGRERAETGSRPAHLARRLLGARPRDEPLHLVGRDLSHLRAAATAADPEL